jgi:uncharacterized protein (TIGR00730 family)
MMTKDAEESASKRIPNPPDPRGRRQPLPGSRPKPDHEDPIASERVRAIMQSPAYREAEGDLDFLNSYDTRGLRLQLDYLKPELHLQRHDVEHTVVVFGSTRFVEPAAAQAKLDEARRLLSAGARVDENAERRVAVAQRLCDNSRYYEIAREFGAIVGANSRIAIVTGGGPGIMEAANRGAFDVGAQTVGMNITLPSEQFPNPYVTPELCFKFHYFALRKMHFLLRARALVAFPGGYGTFDELFETLTLVQTRKIKPLPVVLVGEAYWRKAFDPDFLISEGALDPEDRELFWYAESAEDIWSGVVAWHRRAGIEISL